MWVGSLRVCNEVCGGPGARHVVVLRFRWWGAPRVAPEDGEVAERRGELAADPLVPSLRRGGRVQRRAGMAAFRRHPPGAADGACLFRTGHSGVREGRQLPRQGVTLQLEDSEGGQRREGGGQGAGHAPATRPLTPGVLDYQPAFVYPDTQVVTGGSA